MSAWTETTLGEACELYQPQTISSAELIADGNYPVYGANGIIGRYNKFNHEESQLLVTCRGATCGTINISQPYAWINGNAMVVRPRDETLNLKYLAHLFRGGIDLSVAITGAAQPQITRQSLAPLRIRIPLLEEQRRIAAILDQAETLQTQRRTALALLDSLTQSLFLDMFGDMQVEPDRWPYAAFEDIVQDSRIGLVRGSQELNDENPYPYLRMNAITRDGDLKLEGALRAKATTEELETYCLRHNDFLFNTRNSRDLVGKTALFRGNGIYLFNNNLLRVRFTEVTHPEYMLSVFKTPFIQKELELRKSGTTNVFAVYYKDLRTLPIPLPPTPLQQTFATRIQSIEAIKVTHRRALAALDALFASLQQRAFAGLL